jgi:hypothetical protein
MLRKTSAFAISALVTLALPLTVLAQDPTGSPAVVSGGGSAPDKQAPMPNTFGTSFVSYVEVPANAFLPYNSGETYTSDNFGAGPRWVTGGSSGSHTLAAPLHLPSGAKVTYLELDYHDTSATTYTYGSLYFCDYHGLGCTAHPTAGFGPADCLIAGFICSGVAATDGDSEWDADLTPDNIVADNYTKSFTLLAIPSAFDGSEKVAGMIVGYVLQVSPSPGVATFSDVPLSDYRNKFVEALYSAGITAGCGGSPPHFCPDLPLTRGQMAVFLAAALGLQWN